MLAFLLGPGPGNLCLTFPCLSDAALLSWPPSSRADLLLVPGSTLSLPSEPSSPGPADCAREKSDFLLLLCQVLLQAGSELP